MPAPTLPPAPLMALAGCWNLRNGEHPTLAAPLAEVFATLPLFPTAQQWAELALLGLPLMLAERGHHVLRDDGPHGLTHGASDTPIAPVFVRDLCGRVIHTGLFPLPNLPGTPTFSAGCADVPATMGGATYLENALFSHWLLLEPRAATPESPFAASAPTHQLQAGYASPGRYPYKIRPQTFYADGWRLPQLNRVFARRVAGADEKVAQLMQAWASRANPQTDGADYEAFYESIGGSAKIDELFLQGVTLIPTFEAYNGAFQVSETFQLQGVEAGRAVEGLHTVISQEPSHLPYGTILKVLQPGFVTAAQVTPAHVVVSNGPSLTPTASPDTPLWPNLALPHPHTGPNWGACWLPTQPQHFSAPAIWDWQPNGRFMQIAGPLWCPTHYTYASTAPMVQALRKPLEDCPTLYQLPTRLKDTFAPIIAPNHYDTLNERTRTERLANGNNAETPLFGSALDMLPLGKPTAPIGYHALPRSWPTLGQSAHLPSPPLLAACPPELTAQLAPVASPRSAGPEHPDHAAHHVITTEALRTLLAKSATAEDMPLPDWLPTLPNSQLQINVKRLFASRAYRHALTLVHGKLPEAMLRFKEAALAWRRLRYRLVAKYPAAWLEIEKRNLGLESGEDLTGVLSDTAHTEAKTKLLAQSLLTKLPALAAPALHGAAASGKVKMQKPKPKTALRR